MTGLLDFGIPAALKVPRRELAASLDRAVAKVGGYEPITERTKFRRQDISDAIAEHASRGFRSDWAWAIGMLAPEEQRADIARFLVKPLGYGIAPLVPLTAEQKLARLEFRVAAQFGQAGVSLVEENSR